MQDLSNAQVVSYDSGLHQLVLTKVRENGFTVDKPQAYFVRATSKRYGKLKGLWLKLEPIAYYYDDSLGDPWKVWKVTDDMTKLPNVLVMVRFRIVSAHWSKEDLEKKTRLKGFKRVIDDNEYFTRIPLINELSHTDNGVITTSNYQTSIAWGDKVNAKGYLLDWDTAKITVKNLFDGDELLKMTGRGHAEL